MKSLSMRDNNIVSFILLSAFFCQKLLTLIQLQRLKGQKLNILKMLLFCMNVCFARKVSSLPKIFFIYFNPHPRNITVNSYYKLRYTWNI